MPPILKNLAAHLSDALLPKRKAMAELRARWGIPGDKDGWLASDYFDLVRDHGPGPCIGDKTWIDLEFPEIFASIDSTVTPVGSQVLFQWMHACGGDADERAVRYALYSKLQSDAALRESLQHKLLPLKDEHNARIAHFLFGKLPPALKHQRLLRTWALLSIAVLGIVLALAWPIWIWLAMVGVNAAVLARVGASGRTLRDMQALEACLRLVKVSNDLAAMGEYRPALPQLAALHREGPNRARVSKALGWLLAWSSLEKLFPVSIVVLFFNLAFLAKLVLHVRAMQSFAMLRHELAASFELVGEIDAMIAIASWLTGCPRHCRPALSDHALLDVRDGCHPLLGAGVSNSIRLDHRSALVTGSNMAGKTTFVKMVGVNALLGQTLGFCIASSATIPRAPVMASIQAGHSVASGKSHYFSEVETIQSFLVRQASGGCTVFVIDELFSGTNTMERVAIARAVLESLSEGSIVLATTHDVELQALLEGRYESYHFQESPEVDGFFDYRLRSGPATGRNAIRLLGELGFPDAVIAKAMEYADQELRAGGQHAVRRSHAVPAKPLHST